LRRLAPLSFVGAIVGALLLLRLPAAAFEAIVPVLILISVVLVLVQPRLAAAVQRRRAVAGRGGDRIGTPALAGTLFAGVYGGYFGAAQGILLLAILALSLNDDLQRINAVKVVLAGLVNLVAGIVFVIAAHVAWGAAVLIAAGSIIGGFLGAHGGRRLPESALRALIVIVGIVAIVRLVG
jgi:uncharacterized membrane protein YfcA